ncbi:structural maintenance of chromosomes protein 4 isoform X2 [Planococcus citri]|uniref:structural maintenance of chromosomes protein 4 isoform X2 n=1 Tax=Planococcus citri TaxID=170843 RepID=UPI0031F72347
MKNKGADDSVRSRKKARVDKRREEESRDESDISDTDKFSDDEEGGIRIDDIYIPPAPPPVCSYESNGPRLIITHIVNENFKSYAGRVVVGPFDKSFSSIVGPNGSGKSNVIDSMLFVFGYRATKIRSKKVSVLIHKSEQHQHVPSCKVEVHFAQILDKDNGEYDKIPNSEFVISRTAFQNSSSFYELNYKRVQFKEVAMTLRKHGIDLIHNRFLILQGEVEQIALMKPKGLTPHETGMLEYLEDIIGTTRYKEPIEKLLARIEALNEERQEKLNRLKVVESEREALRGPMEETVNFLKTENRITHLKNKKFQLQLHKINIGFTETQKEKDTLVEECEKIKAKLEEIQAQKGTEKSEMDSLNKALKKLLTRYEEWEKIRQNAEKKDTELIEELKQLKKNQKKTAENLKTEEDKLVGLLKVPEENQEKIERLTEEEAELDQRRKQEEADLQKIMSNLQKETKTFQEEKEKLQAEQIKLKKKYDEMRAEFELAKSERDIYVSSEQTEKTKLEQMVQKLNEVTEMLGENKRELSQLQKDLPEKEKHLQRTQDHLKAVKGKDVSVTNELRKYQAQLEEKKSSMMQNRSQNRVLNFIMKLKMEGKINGIFGRLGDLGAIDEKYDVAISTACGALDFILVDTSSTISSCIRALKDNNVGRATFVALDKIAHHYKRCVPNFKGPENAPRLFDLIRVQDERVIPAFYYALRDTLVADTIEQAKRIGYFYNTRHRVVSLDGGMVELSGTMSGGGRQKIRGKMGSSVAVSTDANSAEEIGQLESRVTTLETQLQQFREQEHECEDMISKLEPEIRTIKTSINKLTVAIESLTKQEPELKAQVKNQEKKVKECAPNENRLRELSKKVEGTEKGARKAEQEANVIEEKVQTVHNKIMEITGGKTKEAQKRLDDVTKEWDKTRSNITKLQVAIKTAERNAKKAQERIDNMKAELEEATKRLTEIDTEKEVVQKDCEKASEKATELKTQIDEQQERLEVLQEEHKKFMQEVNKLKGDKLKEEQKIEAIDKRLEELQRDIPHIKQKLEKLTLHKIPTFKEPADEDDRNEEEAPQSAENADAAAAAAEQAKEDDVLLTYDAETLEAASNSDINADIQKEEEHLKTFTPNLNTLNDYDKKTNQYIERSKELKEITERRNACREGYEEARKNRLHEFMSGFTIISNKLKELYQMLTMGGDAELDLHDSLDPFTEGINFCVRPPKKSWKNITNLSGGEKTLSSLALVFALHYYRPTPLYVMDEIDAALDFKNVSIVGYYIKERTKNAQFIVISLRTNMFELANMLTGIYKTYNCTKTVTICPDQLRKKDPQDPSTSKDRNPPEKSMPPPSRPLVAPPEEPRKRKSKRFSTELAQPTESNNSDKENTDDADLSDMDHNSNEPIPREIMQPAEKRERAKRRPVTKQPVVLDEDTNSSQSTLNLSDIDRDPNENELLQAGLAREKAEKKNQRQHDDNSLNEKELRRVLNNYQNSRSTRNSRKMANVENFE